MKITKAKLKQIIEEELRKVAEAAVPDPEWAGHTYTKQASNPNALDNPKPKIDCARLAIIIKDLEANAGDSGFGQALLKNKRDQFDAAKCQPAASSALQEGIENFTPENLQMVIDSLIQMGIPAGGVVAAAVALTNFFEGKPGDAHEKADLYADAEAAAGERS